MNLRISSGFANQLKARENDSDSSLLQESEFNSSLVLSFWQSLTPQTQDSLLTIKDDTIVESLCQALNNMNFISNVGSESERSLPYKRSYYLPRKDKPSIFFSIYEFETIALSFEDLDFQKYRQAAITILVDSRRGQDSEDLVQKDLSSHQEINEKELRAYIQDFDVLEQANGVFKIKASMARDIWLTFLRIFSDLCHGKKLLSGKEDHKKLFFSFSNDIFYQISAYAKFNRKDLAIASYKLYAALLSIVLLLEDKILDAYIRHSPLPHSQSPLNSYTSPQNQSPDPSSKDLNVFASPETGVNFQNLTSYISSRNQSSTLSMEEQKNLNVHSLVEEEDLHGTQQDYRQHKRSSRFQLFTVSHGIYAGKLSFNIYRHMDEESKYSGAPNSYKNHGRKRYNDEYRGHNDSYRYKGDSRHGYYYNNYSQASNEQDLLDLSVRNQSHDQAVDALHSLLGDSNKITSKKGSGWAGGSHSKYQTPLIKPTVQSGSERAVNEDFSSANVSYSHKNVRSNGMNNKFEEQIVVYSPKTQDGSRDTTQLEILESAKWLQNGKPSKMSIDSTTRGSDGGSREDTEKDSQSSYTKSDSEPASNKMTPESDKQQGARASQHEKKWPQLNGGKKSQRYAGNPSKTEFRGDSKGSGNYKSGKQGYSKSQKAQYPDLSSLEGYPPLPNAMNVGTSTRKM